MKFSLVRYFNSYQSHCSSNLKEDSTLQSIQIGIYSSKDPEILNLCCTLKKVSTFSAQALHFIRIQFVNAMALEVGSRFQEFGSTFQMKMR